MPDEVKPDPNQAQTQDAELVAESVAAGEEQAPVIDVEADYEAAQQFSVSEVDRTGSGAEAAEAATAPQFEVSEPEETRTEAQPTGNPDDFLAMASDAASTTEDVSNVSDDLLKKALDMGKPGQSN